MLFYDTYVFAHIKILCEAFYDTYPCTYFLTNLFMLHPIYIHTHFFGRLLLLPTHKYTYFEKHFYATHPTLCKALHAIYIHIMQGIFMLYIFIFCKAFYSTFCKAFYSTFCKAFPCYIYLHIYIPLKGIFHAT